MGRLNIEDITPGMVLAADLRTPQGRFFLAKGSPLTDGHLRACKMWGVTEAEIEDSSGSQAEQNVLAALPPETLDALKQRTRMHFAGCDTSHPAIRELARQHLLRHASQACQGMLPAPVAPPPHRPKTRAAGTPPPLKAVVARADRMFSLPTIFGKILEVLRDPGSSAASIADAIGKDQNLSAKLLRLVNSSYYGYAERIDSLNRAVMIVGSSRLMTLSMGILTMSVFKNIPRRLMDMTSFWSHGLTCGIVARIMAARLGGADEEPLFLAGLLHDMGRMAFCVQYPELGSQALEEALGHGLPAYRAESAIWGFDHAAVGGAILTSWNFPPHLTRAVADHHSPPPADSGLEAAMVHVADVIAHAMDHGGGQGFPVPPLDPAAFEATGLSPGALSAISIQAQSQLEDVIRIFIEKP
ncbi:MAG: HDOD domain-containing protein [Thermodesulfobacteriota bacterium]